MKCSNKIKMIRKITISLILLLVVITVSKASSIKSFSREWSSTYLIQGKEDYEIGKNNRFIYDDSTNKPERIKNCTIHYEYFNTDGIVYHKKCQITVISETQEDGFGIYYFMVRSHHGNKIIFSYFDDIRDNLEEHHRETKSVHGIMNMETCEYKTYEKRIKLMPSTNDQLALFLTMVPSFIQHEDDSYGIFYYDRNLCNFARCRQIVNKNGNLESEVVPYLPEEYSLRNIQMYPTATPNHYFAVATNNKFFKPLNNTVAHRYDLSLLYATPDGQMEELQHILKNENNVYHYDFSHGHLAVCWVNLTKIYCKQYNSEKMKILDNSFVIPNEVKTLRIANSKHGGFILLTREEKPDCEQISFSYYLRNIGLDGDHGHSVELDFDLPENKKWVLTDDTHLSNEDGKNVCVSIVLSRPYPIDSTSTCLKKKLLRKCLDSQYLQPIEGPYNNDLF